MSKKMKSILTQISLILVLLSNRYYVNTDYIQYIDTKDKWIKIDSKFWGHTSSMDWYLNVSDLEIEQLKKAIGVYGG